jgi:hypothetical protein
MVARRTDRNVKMAEPRPSLDKPLNVLGNEHTQQMRVEITAKTTVHWLWFVMVFRYFALTRTWRA